MAEVVVNTILWFIDHRMKLLQQDAIVNMIVGYYSPEEIDSAREVLYQHFPDEERPNNLRKKSFKMIKRSKKNVKDMILVLHEMSVTDKFSPPTWATVSTNFPSLDVANADAFSTCNDILALKREVAEIKQSTCNVALLNEVKEALIDLKASKITSRPDPKCVEFSRRMVRTDGRAETNCKEVEVSFAKDLPTLAPAECTSAMAGHGVDGSEVKSFAKIVAANLGPHSSPPELTSGSKKHPSEVDEHIVPAGQQQVEDFLLVEKRRRKMKPPIGKKTSMTLRAVKTILKPAQVFLSRLHPNTTEEEIKNFAVKQFVSATAVTCKKLDTKYSSFSSFRIVLNGGFV